MADDAPGKKLGWKGTVVVVVIALVVIGILFGNDTGGSSSSSSSSSSNDDKWTQCIANVGASITNHTIDLDGIDRCNRLYPKP